MENYAFLLVDEADLLAATPPTADAASLATWAVANGAKWDVLRQRPSFLWEAIARVDTALEPRHRFQDRLSRARIGAAWGTIEHVGYFETTTVRELASRFAALASDAQDDPAYSQLTEMLAETFAVATERGMAVLIFRA